MPFVSVPRCPTRCQHANCSYNFCSCLTCMALARMIGHHAYSSCRIAGIETSVMKSTVVYQYTPCTIPGLLNFTIRYLGSTHALKSWIAQLLCFNLAFSKEVLQLLLIVSPQRVSLQNCWQVPGHYQSLTDITSTSTCQTSLTSPHNTRGTGFSM